LKSLCYDARSEKHQIIEIPSFWGEEATVLALLFDRSHTVVL